MAQHVRIPLCCTLLLLTAGWLSSLVLSNGVPTPLRDARAAIETHTSDSLSISFTLTAPAIQQQHALLTWMDADRQRHGLPLLLRADRLPQHILIPVGVSPGWRGTVRAVRLVVPYPDTIVLDIAAMHVVQRPWWALDQGVLRALAPLLPPRVPLPSPASVIVLTTTLLAGPLALLLPWSTWRRRLGMAGVLLACCVAGWTLVQQAMLLRIIVPVSAPLSTQHAHIRRMYTHGNRDSWRIPVFVYYRSRSKHTQPLGCAFALCSLFLVPCSLFYPQAKHHANRH